jgi:Glycosyltransferase family 17
MKIYDCFPFFNELDVLEIRLKEMYDTVDYFVLVESNISHSGKPKEFFFENNKERFKPYLDKIRHIKIEDMPDTQDSWVREKFQRTCIDRGLTDRDPEDLIIVSDCDEIPRAELIQMISQDDAGWDRYILYIPLLKFRLNYMKIFNFTKGSNIIVTRAKTYTNAQQEREFTFFWNSKPNNTVLLEHGGWHFSYLGNDDQVVTKIKNFAHVETDRPRFTENLDVEFLIKNKCGLWGPVRDNDPGFDEEKFEYVKIDDYYPQCIVNDVERWKHHIIPDAEFSITDLYRED